MTSCIRYIDYEKVFDPIEYEAIFKALRSIGIYETYIIIPTILYTGANARVHMDTHISEEIPILRGMRQGDSVSPTLFTATNFGGVQKRRARRDGNKYRWTKTVGPKIC